MLFSWTRRSLLTAIGASALTLALEPEGRAAGMPVKPKGAVILTIAGDIRASLLRHWPESAKGQKLPSG